MRSPNDTHYSIRYLNRVFAVSAVALLVVTVWMLSADHFREWKTYQGTYRKTIDPWLNETRLEAAHRKLHEGAAGDEVSEDVDQRQHQMLDRLGDQKTSTLTHAFLELPGVDALGRTLAIDQIWLPDLTINYHFRDVARFDRCVTCHQGINRVNPDQPGEGRLCHASTVAIEVVLFDEDDEWDSDEDEAGEETNDEAAAEKSVAKKQPVEEKLGFALARQGMLDPNTPTVGYLIERSPAAGAGLKMGDILVEINGQPVAGREDVRRLLTEVLEPADNEQAEEEGEDDEEIEPVSIAMKVRRGAAHPYASHPRLDLFVGQGSPHPASRFGCTICHDGQGSATEFKFVSHTPNNPDQRSRWRNEHGWFHNEHWEWPMLPKRFAESRCLRCHHDVTELEDLGGPGEPPAPKLLKGYHLVRTLGCFACHEIKGFDAQRHRTGPDLRLEPAGTMRKLGPDLRTVGDRLTPEFIRSHVRRPSDFRPESRMPQFFGLEKNIDEKAVEEIRRLEAVEQWAIGDWLASLKNDAPVAEAIEPVANELTLERGRKTFQTQGCLACHTHPDFPESAATQGPQLGRLGSKYANAAGRAWLARWLRDPASLSPRTRMPNPLLTPHTVKSKDGESTQKIDPVADLVAFLTADSSFEPEPVAQPVAEPTDAAIDQLVAVYLATSLPDETIQKYLGEGIPADELANVQGEMAELAAPISREKKLRFAAMRTVRRRGCFACHEIPGMEKAQPIGPAMSDWGRKQESLLAFNHVDRFLDDKKIDVGDPFYRRAIRAMRREGFLWQKIRQPRSFDYQMESTLTYTSRLLMGRFGNLTDDQREAIATFILGLTADPPSSEYLPKPAGPQKALAHGRQLVHEFACAECHTMKMERWRFDYDPEEFETPMADDDFDFLEPQVDPEILDASLKTDIRGLATAEVVGMPQVDETGQAMALEGDEEDAEGEPLPMYAFSLWKPAIVAGEVVRVGGPDLLIYDYQIKRRNPGWGGTFARMLYPIALADAEARGANIAGAEAWGWVPPPLEREGEMVRPDWLYRYLIEPTVIRPAAVLRMPKFNLSSDESKALVEYFTAESGVSSYVDPVPATTHLTKDQNAKRLDDAMRLVIDSTTYCAKCHLIGDFNPGDEVTTSLGPNLSDVGRRLRPEYLRRWLANPKAALPYTGMPVNFPPTGDPMGQNLFEGSSLEQLDAVTELLLNFDVHRSGQMSVRQEMAKRKRASQAEEADEEDDGGAEE